MTRNACALVTLAGLVCLAPGPLVAQQTDGTDFWIGMGRFRTSILVEAPKDPPDLSGTYEVSGFARPGDSSSAYQTTMTMKRNKTVETPQGAKINWYEVRYHFDEPADGLAVHIGSRLYLAYGSEHIALVVGAPLVLTPVEEDAARRARAMQMRVAEANTDYGDGASYVSKGAPWFSAVKIDGADHFHIPSDAPFSTAGLYTLWFNAKGSYGVEVYPQLHPWADGSYRFTTYYQKKGNEARTWDAGAVVVRADGATSQVEQRYGYGPNKGSIPGTSHQLADGTVVWILGGSESAGAGYYEFVNGTLSGLYWTLGASVLGSETLTPAPEVAAKNPTLFASR